MGSEPGRPSKRQRIAALRRALQDRGATTTQIARVLAANDHVNMRVAHRLALGLTQQAVADEYNRRWPATTPRSAKYISYWERWAGPDGPLNAAARAPSLRDLARLADLYGCLIDDLLDGAGAAAAHADFITDDGDVSSTPGPRPGQWTLDQEGGDPTKRRQALRAGTLAAAAAWVDLPAPALWAASPSDTRITPQILSTVAQMVAGAQRLDDRHGGGAALNYVADQYAAVARMLRRDRYDTSTGHQLATFLGQLAQTAGFMAYDGGQDRLARRWYTAGLKAADAADDLLLRASILSLMSNQAVAQGRTRTALQMADAADQAAADGPPKVRALVAARGSLAHAAAADDRAFHHAREHTLASMAATPTAPDPTWAYYVTSTELDAITGRGMVMLARRTSRTRSQRTRLLTNAETMLCGRALTNDPTYSRSELRHSAWLAIAYTLSGDLDQAVTAGHHALQLLPSVHSTRSQGLLTRLRTDLTAHAPRHPHVRDLVHQLPAQPPPAPH